VVVLLEYCLWFWIISLGRKFYNENTAIVLLVSGVVVSSVLSYFMTYPTSETSARAAWPFERWGLVWGVLLYAFFAKAKQFVLPDKAKVATLAFLCCALGVAYLKSKMEFFWGEYLLKIVLGLAIIVFLFTISSKRAFGNKVAFFLGGISYEVYLSHGFVMHVLDDCCPTMPSGAFILTTVALTIAFSTAIHYIGKPIVKAIRTN